MQTFNLDKNEPRLEFELLFNIWSHYRSSPWSIRELHVNTPDGIFLNSGCFNNHPFDLWLSKKGTKGLQARSFWRTGIGNKRAFRVFAYDLRSVSVNPSNLKTVANLIGATLEWDKGLPYFIQSLSRSLHA